MSKTPTDVADVIVTTRLAETFTKLHITPDQANELLLRFIGRNIVTAHDGDVAACKAHSVVLAGHLGRSVTELIPSYRRLKSELGGNDEDTDEPQTFLL